MKTCIYIHGLESKGNSRTAGILCEEFAGILGIVEPKIDYSDIQSVVETIKVAIAKSSSCFLIGSSMGGFVALQFPSVPKILINPALRPTETGIAKRHPQLQSQLSTFLELERYIVEHEIQNCNLGDREDSLFTYGLFGLNDELFSYRAEFERDFNYTLPRNHIFTCPDGHRLSEATVRNQLKTLIEYYLIDSTIFHESHPYYSTFPLFGFDEEEYKRLGIEPPSEERFAKLTADREKILSKLK
ncbi:MAG: hypothetical protein EZS26_001958 [Candidatus Ordinivivax streblomastigis]|uniref:Esterase n=1 Tax=Candidatus Ordinivivax streblomastigis TaxID=2540710 RepID=A0A5M8P0I9_9BACT|nr:MAG: hypothetical protein EZS26_001958 [Candidatus Ordinivivax streblomastigis]